VPRFDPGAGERQDRMDPSPPPSRTRATAATVARATTQRSRVALREHVDHPFVRGEAVVDRPAGLVKPPAGLAGEPGSRQLGGQLVEQQDEQLVLVADMAVDRHR
jgi:hypothetical protein